MTNLLKQAAHNKQVDNALRIAIEAAWDKLDDKPVQEPVACRFCHSKKGCWTWQCYHCGEIDDVQQPTPPAAQPVQEPVAWNVIDPTGNILATEKNAIRGWARVNGYKPTVEGLLGLHELGWRVLPTSPTAAQRPWVGLTKQDIPSGENPMFDHKYFIAGLVYAAKVLQNKNHG
jgi:hypothetical protein